MTRILPEPASAAAVHSLKTPLKPLSTAMILYRPIWDILPATTPQVFDNYPKLPPELRNKVMGYAIANLPPRIISVYLVSLQVEQHKIIVPSEGKIFTGGCSDLIAIHAHADIPNILRVNREARSLGLRVYAKTFACNIVNWGRQGVYFDFTKDILDFEGISTLSVLCLGPNICPGPLKRISLLHTCFCPLPNASSLQGDLTKIERVVTRDPSSFENRLLPRYSARTRSYPITVLKSLKILTVLTDHDQSELSIYGMEQADRRIENRLKTTFQKSWSQGKQLPAVQCVRSAIVEKIYRSFNFGDILEDEHQHKAKRSPILDGIHYCNDSACVGHNQEVVQE